MGKVRLEKLANAGLRGVGLAARVLCGGGFVAVLAATVARFCVPPKS